MPEIELQDLKNNKIGTVEASAGVFDVKIHKPLVQACVNQQLAKRRGGNAATKQNRGDLRGGGKKPWRQKGTGRARQGSIRSAQWRGGLTIFGPSPRSYDFEISKKSRQLALKSALTDRLRNGNFVVVDQISLDTPKTKEAVQVLKDLGGEAHLDCPSDPASETDCNNIVTKCPWSNEVTKNLILCILCRGIAWRFAQYSDQPMTVQLDYTMADGEPECRITVSEKK